MVIGSANVRALYSCLDIVFAVEKVREVFETSGEEIRGIDGEELGLYLAIASKKDELERSGIL